MLVKSFCEERAHEASFLSRIVGRLVLPRKERKAIPRNKGNCRLTGKKCGAMDDPLCDCDFGIAGRAAAECGTD